MVKPQIAAAVCTPGLEKILASEMTALGLKPKRPGPGLVEFPASVRQIYLANYWLRTANRILVRIGTFRATDFIHFEKGAKNIDWARWIPDSMPPSFRVTTHESKLYHTDAIAERLHRIVGKTALGDEPTQPFVIRVDRNTVTVSVDSTGSPLHRRSWRTELGQAPLRPTMAAAALMQLGYLGETPLLDPFCGSGTIAIEAALMARGAAPSPGRSFAFHDWVDFEPGTWGSVTGSGPKPTQNLGLIEASDRDQEVVKAAERNANRAGVADAVSISQKVVSHLDAKPEMGLVFTNPPYGRRVGGENLEGLYKRFGAVLRERRPSWGLALIVADSALAKQADGRLKQISRFRHGGLPVMLLNRSGKETVSEGDTGSYSSAAVDDGVAD